MVSARRKDLQGGRGRWKPFLEHLDDPGRQLSLRARLNKSTHRVIDEKLPPDDSYRTPPMRTFEQDACFFRLLRIQRLSRLHLKQSRDNLEGYYNAPSNVPACCVQ
jgi:hypothetical protein